MDEELHELLVVVVPDGTLELGVFEDVEEGMLEDVEEDPTC